jgi:hypothetical protein
MLREPTVVEKINMTSEEYLHRDPNVVLVEKEKLKKKYKYAIMHYKIINTQLYQLKNTEDIILESYSEGERCYKILSNNLPDPEFIKDWKWKKK